MATIAYVMIIPRSGPPRYCCDIRCSNARWYTDRCWEYRVPGYMDAPFTNARALELAMARAVYWEAKIGDSCPWAPEPPPPTPPPPTPPAEEYTITINTTPGGCTVRLLEEDGTLFKGGVTSAAGLLVLHNVPGAKYILEVSKEGYNDYSKTSTLSMDTVLNVTLSEETAWDWLLGFIIGGFERLLGWQTGTLTTKLGQMWDMITNFGGQIADFFSDGIGTVIDWVKDNAGNIFDWLGDNFSNFIDFLNDVGGDIADFVEDKISGVADFLTEGVGDFFDWLGEISGSIADYIGGAIGDFVDWSSDQLGGIWEGLQNWFTEAISGFVESFFSGLDTGVEEAKGSPLHSDEPVRNPVVKGLQKVVREHRKKYGRDEITGEK